jgi:DNA-binding CsgD family transcriptional regulator
MSAVDRWSQPVDATLYLEGEMECGLMGHKFHRGFTAAEKTELWDRWKRGESGKQSSSIYFLVSPDGGIRPAQRRRSKLALTLAEREVISRGVTTHQSARSIARLLGRSPSTVSREMSRNGGCDRYRAALADEIAWARARRPKCCKLANSPRLRQAVAGKLRLDWSPEQIAGWLKRTHPEDECNQVSHETIYRSLFVQTLACSRKSCLVIFDRSARCVALRWRPKSTYIFADPQSRGSAGRTRTPMACCDNTSRRAPIYRCIRKPI